MNSPRKLILIVEDDCWTRTALARILQYKGWDVAVAGTVALGLELVMQSSPDCVILDLLLPDGNGEIILRQVRESKLPTRVVVCTSIFEPGRLEGVRKLQPDALFVKPIDVEEMLLACDR
jgi:DNA-binding response OmpR family regulator